MCVVYVCIVPLSYLRSINKQLDYGWVWVRCFPRKNVEESSAQEGKYRTQKHYAISIRGLAQR